MTDQNPELSLADVTWLTGLARTLTRDDALADDLVQEAWLTARRSQPATGVNRPWLAGVLRHLHLNFRRSERRRSKREQAVSSKEGMSEPSDLIERAELQRALADCLLGLEEPYRTTLMHVAFDERSPKQIAESESVSVESVRRRLRKARELFKNKLEREYGRDWKQWYAALLPFAELPLPGDVAPAPFAPSPGLPSTKVALGGLLVSKTIFVTVLAAPVLLMVLWPSISNWGTRGTDIENTIVATKAESATVQEPRPNTSTPTRREVPITGPALNDPGSGAKPFVVSGTMVVKDESGNRYSRTSGSFKMGVTPKGADGKTIGVEVLDGRWTLELDPGAETELVAYAGLILDDRAAKFTGDWRSVIRGNTEIELTAKWLARHQVDVLDAETRQHLSMIQVTEVAMSFDRFSTPGVIRQESVVVRDAHSPLQLGPKSSFADTFFVGCPGYAWQLLQLDPNKSDRHEVLLERGADLTVRFEPHAAREGKQPVQFRISVANKQNIEWATATDSNEAVQLTGLQPARYILEARSHRAADVLRQEIDLIAGTHETTLGVPQFDQQSVNVAGTLAVHEHLKPELYSMWLQRVVPPTDSAAHPWNSLGVYKVIGLADMRRVDDTLHFDAGKLPTGSYSVSVSPNSTYEALWQTNCEITSSNATDLEFELPTLGEAYLRVLDAQSEEVMTPKTAVLGTSFQFDGGKAKAEFEESNGRWRVTGPPGRVRCTVCTLDHEPFKVEVELRAKDPTENEIRLQSRTYFVFRLYDEEELILVGEDWFKRCKVVQTRGKTVEPKIGWNGKGTGFNLIEPGAFFVTFPELEGYLPIAEQAVEVRKGERRLIRVQLQRRR